MTGSSTVEAYITAQLEHILELANTQALYTKYSIWICFVISDVAGTLQQLPAVHRFKRCLHVEQPTKGFHNQAHVT